MQNNTENLSPFWVGSLLIPVLNLVAALILSSAVILLLGESPLEAISLIIKGTFASSEGLGYTLYYATNFIFTGLAVSIAYHAGLFNIGAEGQALMGGVGLALGVFAFGDTSPLLAFIAGLFGSIFFGAFWAFIPAWMQAKRGAHIVITTIMFNYIALGVLAYLVTGPLQNKQGGMPESDIFPAGVGMAHLSDVFAAIGISLELGSANLSLFIALSLAFLVWILLWRTRLGYAIRVVGYNADAARFAGVSVTRISIIAMMLSGAVAGLMGINELLGEQSRLVNAFTQEAGFVGIAVAFMGRNKPLGIVFSALLFGVLTQGGFEMSFEMENITQYLIVIIQGIVILFSGAMEHLFKDPIKRYFPKYFSRKASSVPPIEETHKNPHSPAKEGPC